MSQQGPITVSCIVGAVTGMAAPRFSNVLLDLAAGLGIAVISGIAAWIVMTGIGEVFQRRNQDES